MIAMNKKISDDNYFRLIKPMVVKNILRFYQSTVRTGKFAHRQNNYRNYMLETRKFNNYFDIPESYIEAISICKTSYIEEEVFNTIGKFFKEQDYIYLLPIFLIHKSDNIPLGIYSIDFIDGVLYKFEELNNIICNKDLMEEDFNMCISYFLDIKQCSLIDEELGFINGIIQIGRLYENIEQVSRQNNMSTYSKFIPQQSFTHDLGINCREQLFIKNQILRENS